MSDTTWVRFYSAIFITIVGCMALLPAVGLADRGDDLIAKLKSSNVSERREAARELGKRKEVKAVGALIEMLKDEEPMVRLDASGGLVEIGEPVVDPLLRQIKHETHGAFLWNAIRVLDMLGFKRAIPVLQEIGKTSADPNIQQVARYTIERLERSGK